jgi:hypothetical protein
LRETRPVAYVYAYAYAYAKVQSHKSHANLARGYSDKGLVFIEMVEESQVSLLLVRHHMDR